MNSDPIASLSVDQLETRTSSWPEIISTFPNLVAEIENHAVRLVRMLPKVERSPLGTGVLDSDGCFQVDLDAISSAYAIAKNDSSAPDPRLEFDFPDYPGLVRLWDIFDPGAETLPSVMASLFSTDRFTLRKLQEDRETQRLDRPICPCCQRKAAERVRYASMHPLFDIFMSATRKSEPLRVRAAAPYADFSVPILPFNVEVDQGIITVIDEDCPTAFHVAIRWLHAMGIKQVKLDGTSYAQLVGYDSFGGELFHVASPNPEDCEEWKDSCEWSKQFFTR